MKPSTLTLICGSILTITAAFANGQQPTPATQPAQPPSQPSTQPGGTPRPTTPRPAGIPADPSRRQASGAEDAILRQLEGTFKVDVTINPALWGGKEGKPSVRGAHPVQTTPRSGTGNDPSKTTPEQNDKTKDADDRGTTPSDPAQPGAEDKHAGMGSSFSGFAQNRVLLNGNVLEEHVIVPGMGHGEAQKPDAVRPAQPGGAVPAINAADAFQGLMVLSFDDSTRTYGLAFIDSTMGRMHYATGEFDATTKRLTFNGNGMDHDDSDRGMDRDRAGDNDRVNNDRATPAGREPGDRTDQPGTIRNRNSNNEPRTNPNEGTGGTSDSQVGKTGENPSNAGQHGGAQMPMRQRGGMGDIRVVVELIGNDQHRVTAYRTGMERSGNAGENSPSNTSPSNTATGKPEAVAGDGPAEGDVIYRATFTRISGSDADRAGEIFKNAPANLGNNPGTARPIAPKTPGTR